MSYFVGVKGAAIAYGEGKNVQLEQLLQGEKQIRAKQGMDVFRWLNKDTSEHMGKVFERKALVNFLADSGASDTAGQDPEEGDEPSSSPKPKAPKATHTFDSIKQQVDSLWTERNREAAGLTGDAEIEGLAATGSAGRWSCCATGTAIFVQRRVRGRARPSNLTRAAWGTA